MRCNRGFCSWRNQGIQLTGILALALMGALMLMATRPSWLEQRLGGLDHLYQLHKWSGITAGSGVAAQLLTKIRWLVDWVSYHVRAKTGGHTCTGCLAGYCQEDGNTASYADPVYDDHQSG